MDPTRDNFQPLVLVRPLLVAHFLYIILSQRIIHTFFRLGSFQLPLFSVIQGTTMLSKLSKTFLTLPYLFFPHPFTQSLPRCCHQHLPRLLCPFPFPFPFPFHRIQQRTLRVLPCFVHPAGRSPTRIRACRARLSVRCAIAGCFPRERPTNRARPSWKAKPSAYRRWSKA